MPNFILAYHGGKKPETPEAGAAEMEKWKALFVIKIKYGGLTIVH